MNAGHLAILLPLAAPLARARAAAPDGCGYLIGLLAASDADSSSGICEEEFHSFLSTIDDPSYIADYLSSFASFDELPWAFRIVHKSLSCHCEKLGFGEGCCLGDAAEVHVPTATGVAVAEAKGVAVAEGEMESYRDLLCQQLSYVLETVPRPARPAIASAADPPINAVGVLELEGILGIAIALLFLLSAAVLLALRWRESARLREFAGDPATEEDMEAASTRMEGTPRPGSDGGSVINFEDDGGPAALAWSESEAITSMEESMPGGDPALGDAVRSSLAAMGAASTLAASLKDSDSKAGVFI